MKPVLHSATNATGVALAASPAAGRGRHGGDCGLGHARILPHRGADRVAA